MSTYRLASSVQDHTIATALARFIQRTSRRGGTTSSNSGRDKSFVYDLNKEPGTVRVRVAFVPRSAEVQPGFSRFDTLPPPPFPHFFNTYSIPICIPLLLLCSAAVCWLGQLWVSVKSWSLFSHCSLQTICWGKRSTHSRLCHSRSVNDSQDCAHSVNGLLLLCITSAVVDWVQLSLFVSSCHPWYAHHEYQSTSLLNGRTRRRWVLRESRARITDREYPGKYRAAV